MPVTMFCDNHEELRTHPFSGVIRKVYDILGGGRRRSVAALIFKILIKIEGGAYRSATMRELMARDYKIEVGVHSYGEAFVPGAFAPAVRVGKYVSIARGVRVFTQNHPIDHLSTHPYFYDETFGIVEAGVLDPGVTEIGHDVWIGQNAILLPGCKKVGNGAIIGAGAVVTKDVDAYAVVGGNPAKVIRYRFDEPLREQLAAQKWWDCKFEELGDLKLKELQA